MSKKFTVALGLGCPFCGESFWIDKKEAQHRNCDETECHNCGRKISQRLQRARRKAQREIGKWLKA